MSFNRLTFNGSQGFNPLANLLSPTTANRIDIIATVTVTALNTFGGYIYGNRSGSAACRIAVNSSGVLGTQYITFEPSSYTVTLGLPFELRLNLQGSGNQTLYVNGTSVLSPSAGLSPIGTAGCLGNDQFGTYLVSGYGLIGVIENWCIKVNEVVHRDASFFNGLIASGGRPLSRLINTGG